MPQLQESFIRSIFVSEAIPAILSVSTKMKPFLPIPLGSCSRACRPSHPSSSSRPLASQFAGGTVDFFYTLAASASATDGSWLLPTFQIATQTIRSETRCLNRTVQTKILGLAMVACCMAGVPSHNASWILLASLSTFASKFFITASGISLPEGLSTSSKRLPLEPPQPMAPGSFQPFRLLHTPLDRRRGA